MTVLLSLCTLSIKTSEDSCRYFHHKAENNYKLLT